VKQLLVISGKGGTGKTTIAGSFAVLAKNKVLADCDVDAPNLHLLLKPEVKMSGDFYGGKKALIDAEECRQCGKCVELCRFVAISDDFQVNPLLCEGCGVCFHACPYEAVSLIDDLSGNWYISETVYGPFAHARLGVAAENSGKLVAKVREKASELAGEKDKNLIIIDGPPGTGCPVVASLSGVDLALVVTEPTIAGIHDLVRILGVADHFGVRKAVCINKYDLDQEKSKEIESYCAENGVTVAGKIYYDPAVSGSLAAATPLVNYAGNKMARQVINLWQSVEKLL